MVDRKWAFIVALIVLCSPVTAQNTDPEVDSPGYRYVMDSDGNPVYSQLLSWEGDPNALEYQISLFDGSGKEILFTSQEETTLEVFLSPGDYLYKIVTINLLGQAESETDFLPITIIHAELPEILTVSPGSIFMDSFEPFITIEGVLFQEEAQIILSENGKNDSGVEGLVFRREGESLLVVEFPLTAYFPGAFDITVINPGGLFSTMHNAINIMYEHPMDILVSCGYSPVSLFYDNWTKETWDKPMYWLGADTSFSWYFLKNTWGFLGLGVDISAHRWAGGLDLAEITSDYYLSGLNMLYCFRINNMFHLLARAGTGLFVSCHSFDFDGTEGPKDYFSGMSIQAGLAIQYFLPQNFYFEVGADWVQLFQGENILGMIRPLVRFGYRFF